MIVFENNNDLEPYKKLRDLYDLALSKNQMNIEAILIASFSHEDNEVDSRFVNLKYVNNEKFIFFTNYESPKSKQFESHSQISAVIYWNKVDIQIRMKAKILKLDSIHSDEHFKKRKKEKNALAISSKQSRPIDSYENVEKDFAEVMKQENLQIRPHYWGGYEFTPYFFEFWSGNENRLNKRESYHLNNEIWIKTFLQP